MARSRNQNKLPALCGRDLRDLALAYVGRYATTRQKLVRYLSRKLRERGWAGDEEPDLDGLALDFSRLGYVNDAAYAQMKGVSMKRRGYGAARVRAALVADGVDEAERSDAVQEVRQDSWIAADIFAKRKRIGPYGVGLTDPRMRERQIAAFLRAGHDLATARRWVDAEPGSFPERSD